jgi:hypothetical protein
VADVGEKPTAEELAEGDSPEKESDVVSTATVTKSILEQHPYLNQPFKHFENLKPMVYKPEVTELPKDPTPPGWMYQTTAEPKSTSTYQIFPELKEELDKSDSLFVQNEEQKESNLWSKTAQAISEEDYLNISQERLEQQVNYYASMLRNKQIDPKDIPGPLLPLVKSRV